MIEVLILVLPKQRYTVKLQDCLQVISSDVPCLSNKTSVEVWRWARRHRAKVYNEAFLPTHVEGNYVILHANSQLNQTTQN